jgi:hypothetical protein
VLVELAILLPIMLLLLMAVIEFGWLFHGYIIVTAAAREGARTAVVLAPDADVEASVESAADTVFGPEDITLVNNSQFSSQSPSAGELLLTIVPDNPDDRDSGTEVETKLKGALGLLTPLMQAFLPDPFPITGAASMRVE